MRPESDANKSLSDSPRGFEFECPLCDGVKGRANVDARTGEWVISCWYCSQRSYLFDLADALRVPGGGYRLKEDPHRWLEPYVRRTASKPTKPESLPSAEDIRAWRRMLDNDPDVMRYLLAERGISRHVIERTHLGYDGDAITIPIYHVRTRSSSTCVDASAPDAPRPAASTKGWQAARSRTAA